MVGKIVAPLLHGRQPLALRSVAQQDIGQQGNGDDGGSREDECACQEVELGVGTIEPGAEPYGSIAGHWAYESAAHVMCAVPDGHHGASFIL